MGIIALLVSLIFGFYHFTIPFVYKVTPYSPLALNTLTPSLSADEAIAYATKAQETLNGHIALSDVYIWEYKDYPSPLRGEMVPALMVAALAKLGGGIVPGFVLADFIWPVISFLLLTRFFRLLTGKKYFSMVTALMIMFFYNYFRFFPFLPSAGLFLIRAVSSGYSSPFLRSFHPQVSFPFFMLAMIALWQKRWLALGIALGLLFYTDFFYWTFMLTLVALNRQWKSLILGLVLGLPYFINAWLFSRLDLSQSFITNLTFKPEGETLAIAMALVLLLTARWFLSDKKQSIFWQLYYGAVITLFFGSFLLGLAFDDPVGHLKMRLIYPMTLGFLVILVNQWLRLKRGFWLAATILLLLYQTRVHWQWFGRQAQAFYLEPERQEVFDWINLNIPRDSVVLTTGLKDNLYLPIYTHANVFIPRSVFSIAPDSEALERFLIVYKAAGIPSERLREMFTLTEANKELKAKGRFNFDDCAGHYLYFRRFIGKDYYNCSVSPEQLDLILEQYQHTQPDLTKYRADYWLWGPNENQWAKTESEQIANWQLVWENQHYQLYKINDEI